LLELKVKLKSVVFFDRDRGGEGGIAQLIINLGTWWRRVVIMLRPFFPDKEIPVLCEYEPQNSCMYVFQTVSIVKFSVRPLSTGKL